MLKRRECSQVHNDINHLVPARESRTPSDLPQPPENVLASAKSLRNLVSCQHLNIRFYIEIQVSSICRTIRISRNIEPVFPMKATEWCLAAK